MVPNPTAAVDPAVQGFENLSLDVLRAAFRKGCSGSEEEYEALDVDEFTEAFEDIFELPRDQLHVMFMRIDANGSGTVDWDELVSFLLLNSRVYSDASMQEENKCYEEEYVQPSVPHSRWHHHTDTVSKIVIHPKLPLYYTAGQDGVVRMWNANGLSHEAIIQNGTAWVTDLVHIPTSATFPSGLLVASSIDKIITLYDSVNGDLIRTYRGKRKRARDSQIEYIHRQDAINHDKQKKRENPWSEGSSRSFHQSNFMSHFRKQQRIEVVLLEHLVSPPWALTNCTIGGQHRLFVGTADSHILVYDITREHTFSNSIPCINGSGWKTSHGGCITNLVSVPSMDCLITSSTDTTLKILDLESGTNLRVLGSAPPAELVTNKRHPPGMLNTQMTRGRPVRGNTTNLIDLDVLQSEVDLGHRKSIHTFAWCEERHLIASCGMERHVLIWNPFISKPIMKLEGHRTPLVDVIFNHNDNQVISLAADKTIKIWDLRTFHCMQTLTDHRRYPPENRLGVLAYDQKRSRIVSAHTAIVATQLRDGTPDKKEEEIENNSKRIQTNQLRLVGTTYSKLFNQVVVCYDIRVVTWDVSGQQAIAAWEVPEVITALCLDCNERRLLTCTKQKTIILWNYANAQSLQVINLNIESIQHIMSDCDSYINWKSNKDVQNKNIDNRIRLCCYFTILRPHAVKLIVCILGNKLLLVDDSESESDKSLSASVKCISLPDNISGIYCMSLMLPNILILGTGCGSLCLVSLGQQLSKPVVVERMLCPYYVGLLSGPLLSGVLSKQCDEKEDFVDLQCVSDITEDIVCLKKSPRIVITSHGDGLITVWDLPPEKPLSNHKRSSFSFLAATQRGEPINSMCLSSTEDQLYTVDVHGYCNVYDVSCVHGVYFDPTKIYKLHGHRISDQGFSSIHRTQISGLLLGALSNSEVVLFTEDGRLVANFGSRHCKAIPPATQQLLQNVGEANCDLINEVMSTAMSLKVRDHPARILSHNQAKQRLVEIASNMIETAPTASRVSSLADVLSLGDDRKRSNCSFPPIPRKRSCESPTSPLFGIRRSLFQIPLSPSERRKRSEEVDQKTNIITQIFNNYQSTFESFDEFAKLIQDEMQKRKDEQVSQVAPRPVSRMLSERGKERPRSRSRLQSYSRPSSRSLRMRSPEPPSGKSSRPERRDAKAPPPPRILEIKRVMNVDISTPVSTPGGCPFRAKRRKKKPRRMISSFYNGDLKELPAWKPGWIGPQLPPGVYPPIKETNYQFGLSQLEGVDTSDQKPEEPPTTRPSSSKRYRKRKHRFSEAVRAYSKDILSSKIAEIHVENPKAFNLYSHCDENWKQAFGESTTVENNIIPPTPPLQWMSCSQDVEELDIEKRRKCRPRMSYGEPGRKATAFNEVSKSDDQPPAVVENKATLSIQGADLIEPITDTVVSTETALRPSTPPRESTPLERASRELQDAVLLSDRELSHNKATTRSRILTRVVIAKVRVVKDPRSTQRKVIDTDSFGHPLAV